MTRCIALLGLALLAGCVNFDTIGGTAKPNPEMERLLTRDQPAPPGLVIPERISPGNARQQAKALADELSRDQGEMGSK